VQTNSNVKSPGLTAELIRGTVFGCCKQAVIEVVVHRIRLAKVAQAHVHQVLQYTGYVVFFPKGYGGPEQLCFYLFFFAMP